MTGACSRRVGGARRRVAWFALAYTTVLPSSFVCSAGRIRGGCAHASRAARVGPDAGLAMTCSAFSRSRLATAALVPLPIPDTGLPHPMRTSASGVLVDLNSLTPSAPPGKLLQPRTR